MPSANGASGFTLVEMMLAAGILAIIGLTIVATFAGGLNILYRMEGYTAAKADVLLSMERLERDIVNTFSYAGIDFIGDSGKITFPGIVRMSDASNLPQGESIGSISYYVADSAKAKALFRETKNYSQALKEDSEAKGDIVSLAELEGIKFKYYAYDSKIGLYGWVDFWDLSDEDEEKPGDGKAKKGIVLLKDRKENIPLGVRIEVSYKDGDRDISLSRTVFLQPAVSLNLAKVRAAKKEKDSAKAKSEK